MQSREIIDVSLTAPKNFKIGMLSDVYELILFKFGHDGKYY